MGLWTDFTARFSGRRKMTVDEWFSEFGGPTQSAAGITVTQYNALQVTTFLSCVSILAEDVAKLPARVYKLNDKGGREIQANHPLDALLRRPNDYQSSFEFFEQMMTGFLMRGNAYAPIIRDGRGKPIALIPVNPERVSVYEAPSGDVFYMVARRGPHDTAMLKSLPLMIHSEDMLHLRWLSLDNSLWGSSRIALAREAIALALSQQEMASRLSANSTNLGGILTTDQKLSKEAAERLQKSWKERKQGLRNTGETAVLEQGLKWQQLGMTAQDAEFIASRNLQIAEIARLFRMPPHKVGVMDAGLGKSVEQLDQDYVNNTVSSHLRRWEEKLSQTFGLAEQGMFVEFDVSQFLRASMQVRYNGYRTGIVGMFLTPNEARRSEGLPDHPQGNTLYQPTNVAEIGFEPSGKETGPGSDVTGAAAPGGTGDPAAVESTDASDGG